MIRDTAWYELGRAPIEYGGELMLRQRGDEFEIRVDGRELMSTRAHGSEVELARLACAHLTRREAPRVLVGGLGLGYTLRATLDLLPPEGRVVVAELVPALIQWNRQFLGHLNDHPLADARSEVYAGDVAALLIQTTIPYDAIILDVDNGPMDLTRHDNELLYRAEGLAIIRDSLRAGGVLAVWSSEDSDDFRMRLRRAGFSARTVRVLARGEVGNPHHFIFLGRMRNPRPVLT